MQESLPEQLFDLDPVNEICQRYYPNQINCLQATTQTQYWLNGPDPLDYINIYINDDLGFSSHFHYISLGLSDLYGDERIHKRVKTTDEYSGYGYELTIRVKKALNEKQPPMWPIKLLQALARYTFNNGALLDVGDHIPNILNQFNSRLKHLLITEDFVLRRAETKHGRLKFLQLVGCTDDELSVAQKWSARKVLDLMKQWDEIGNDYLVTDLKRNRSLFEAYPILKDITHQQITKDGSNLSFIKSNCIWKSNVLYDENQTMVVQFKNFQSLDLFIDLKTAQIFPMIIKERLRKQNSFILNGIDSRSLIFIPKGFKNQGCHVNDLNPLKSSIQQSQIYLNDIALDNLEDFFQLNNIASKDLKDLPIRETFYLIQENMESSRSKDLNSNKEVYVLNMNIIPNQEILDLNDVDGEEDGAEGEER